LTEVLVAIALIVLLLALTIPSLLRSRSAARATVSSTNCRTLLSVLTTYADSNQERYPTVEPGVFYPSESRDLLLMFPYWYIYQTWTGVVYDILPYADHVGVYLSPGSPRTRQIGNRWPPSYHLSTTVAGDPALWRSGAPADPTLQRAMRVSNVRYPSQKAILWDGEASFAPRPPTREATSGSLAIPTPVGMADLSVSFRTPAEATPPIINPFTGNPARFQHLHNTEGGVYGHDY
jgi:hypothetical protein